MRGFGGDSADASGLVVLCVGNDPDDTASPSGPRWYTVPPMKSDRIRASVAVVLGRASLDDVHAYWADLVLAEFAFLEGRGGQVESFEFSASGDSIAYAGPWGSVVLAFSPGGYPSRTWISGTARLRGGGRAFERGLDDLLIARHPADGLPPSGPLTRATIEANVRAWASVLRDAWDLF